MRTFLSFDDLPSHSEIVDMSYKDPFIDMSQRTKSPREIKLRVKFCELWALFCDFNERGQLIFFWQNKRDDNRKMICVFSIQAEKHVRVTRCLKAYMMQKEIKLISVLKDDKIWLRLYNDVYEWDRINGHTTIIYKNMLRVIINDELYISCWWCKWLGEVY